MAKCGLAKSGHDPRWTSFLRTAQNFALFSLSCHNFLSFFPLLGVLSWNFGGVSKRQDPSMCTFGVLGLSRETPAASGQTWSLLLDSVPDARIPARGISELSRGGLNQIIQAPCTRAPPLTEFICPEVRFSINSTPKEASTRSKARELNLWRVSGRRYHAAGGILTCCTPPTNQLEVLFASGQLENQSMC